MEEIWKDVLGYEGIYKVSNLGRIKSLIRKKESYLNKNRQATLVKNRKRECLPVAKIVLGAFNGYQSNSILYKDGNSENVCLENLGYQEVTIENEIWKDIEGYEGLYQVSNYERIKSIAINGQIRILKPGISLGYKMVVLQSEGYKKTIAVHRLVALSFVPNTENRKHINHINRNKLDCRPVNLEWCNHRENASHNRLSRPKTSKYIGVCLCKATSKWSAAISMKSKNKHLGFFDTEEGARDAYIQALDTFHLENKYAV